MCGLCVCVCVSLPTYQATEGCRFHEFIPLSIKHSTLASLPFFCCLCTSDPITLPFPLPLSVGFWALNYFPYHLWPSRSHPPCLWPSESEQPWERVGGLIYRYRGQRTFREVGRGSHCFTIPQTEPVLWVRGDLVIGCAGSEEQCQRTCGRHVEIWEVYCNGVMSLFAAPSS